MPDMPAAPSQASARRDRSIQARRNTREAKADRERRIVDLLNRGLSVPEIASRSGVSIKHMRNLVRKILAERMPQPPGEFLALQVSRLNEALLVSYSAMHNSATGTNF
jgi:DNA-binding CsgD family transcriptional regulator